MTEKIKVRGMIYGASYDGCSGWTTWNIKEIRFSCRPERVAAAKERAEDRVRMTGTTISRRSIEWKTPK